MVKIVYIHLAIHLFRLLGFQKNALNVPDEGKFRKDL